MVSKRKGGMDGTRRSICRRSIWTCFVLSPVVILLTLWIFAALRVFLTLAEFDALSGDHIGRDVVVASRVKNAPHQANNNNPRLHQQTIKAEYSSLPLSRNRKLKISSSARGNLGPPSVLNQDPPGEDWLKDRWQAASDMGGTAIPGSHWVAMDFTGLFSATGEANGNDERVGGAVHVAKIVLDWETAYAENYRIEGRLTPPPPPKQNGRGLRNGGGDDAGWCVLYDGASDDDGDADADKTHDYRIYPRRSVREYGRSPGVKQKLPLHIVHTIDWAEQNDDRDDESKQGVENCRALRHLRLFIRKPARGWGVSLWEVDVFGTVVD